MTKQKGGRTVSKAAQGVVGNGGEGEKGRAIGTSSAVPNRDSRGRFFPAGKMDAGQKNSQRWLEENNRLAKVYVEVCEKIGHPELAKHLDIKQYPETGNWHIGHRTANFFYGFSVGALFGQKEGKDKVLAVYSLLKETWAIGENISQINDERAKLIEQVDA